jgi:integrase
MPWREMPSFWSELACHDDTPALALRFAVLTAARTDEMRLARWSEIDRAAGVWTIPAERMKGKREHRVPLTAAMCELLDRLAAVRQGDYLFPGAKPRRPIGPNALSLVVKALRVGVTTHGMRSSFRDWAAEHGVAREIAEACLAHANGDKVEAAYLRSDVLERRRVVMEHWSQFLVTPAEEGTVVLLRGRVTGQ